MRAIAWMGTLLLAGSGLGGELALRAEDERPAGGAAEAEELSTSQQKRLGFAAAQRIQKGQTDDELASGLEEDLKAAREKPADGEPAAETPESPKTPQPAGCAWNDDQLQHIGWLVSKKMADGLRGSALACAVRAEILRCKAEAETQEAKKKANGKTDKKADSKDPAQPAAKNPPPLGKSQGGKSPAAGKPKKK